MLQEGGNAIDAAVTAAAVLSVVEPTMTGIGGDLFALVYDPRAGTVIGLNASGRAPDAATPEEFRRRNLDDIPNHGELSVSVPGVVDGWDRLLKRFGTISLERALQPAIAYARDGFAVSDIIAQQWRGAASTLARDPAAAATFLAGGRAPATGEVFSNPRLAATLDRIAKDGRDAFYRGAIAQAIDADMKRRGGLLAARDLADHTSDWVDPISTTYRGYQVLEMPPNTQGVAALEMLNILEGFDLSGLGHNSAAYLHLLVEATRIAFADRDAYVADPASVPAPVLQMLLSKDYAAARRKEIDPARAAEAYAPGTVPPGPERRPPSHHSSALAGPPASAIATARLAEAQRRRHPRSLALRDSPTRASRRQQAPPRGTGDTVYLTVADRQGNVISLIQSLFDTFGAGIVAGDTGVALHNRGSLFTLDPGSPNVLAPRKRPLHTLVPAMVLKDGKPFWSFGVMGGDMQPQGHVQVLVNLIDFGMNVQEAGEAPRFRHTANGVALESAISLDARAGLTQRGHRLLDSRGVFGGYQGILIDPRSGVLMGGSDPRKDGLAIGY